MKFRNPKTGEVFEGIERARTSYCSGKDCDHDCEIAFKQTTCSQWAKDHPADAARRMGLEVITDEEEPVKKKDKPRICQVLGVEVGEVFTADTPYGRFQRCVIDEEGQILNTGTNVLCYILNHPDRIIRKPRFTQEEVERAKAILMLYPKAETMEVVCPYIRIFGGGFLLTHVDAELFPSLRPGQAVRLEDIT